LTLLARHARVALRAGPSRRAGIALRTVVAQLSLGADARYAPFAGLARVAGRTHHTLETRQAGPTRNTRLSFISRWTFISKAISKSKYRYCFALQQEFKFVTTYVLRLSNIEYIISVVNWQKFRQKYKRDRIKFSAAGKIYGDI
jgi:hypothetical protein